MKVKKLKNLKVNQHYVMANNNDITLYVHYSPEDKLIDSVKGFVKQMATHTHGIFIGDDYHESWPGVMRAANEFAAKVGAKLEIHAPKWIIRKPALGVC